MIFCVHTLSIKKIKSKNLKTYLPSIVSRSSITICTLYQLKKPNQNTWRHIFQGSDRGSSVNQSIFIQKSIQKRPQKRKIRFPRGILLQGITVRISKKSGSKYHSISKTVRVCGAFALIPQSGSGAKSQEILWDFALPGGGVKVPSSGPRAGSTPIILNFHKWPPCALIGRAARLYSNRMIVSLFLTK